MSLKTREVLKIFQPFDYQMKKLSELLKYHQKNPKEMVQVQETVLNYLQGLADQFESTYQENSECYKDIKKKMISIIDECKTFNFDSANTEIFIQLNQQFGTISKKFLQVLEKLEHLEVLVIQQSITDCLDYVKDMGRAREIEDFLNIKELGTTLIDILQSLQIYKKNLISKLLSDKLALFSCQLSTSFSILVQLIKQQHNLKAPIYTCKKYICDRIYFCLESILLIIDASNPTKEEEVFEQENNFVYRNDLVLDMISNLSCKSPEDQIKECEEIWLGIEDIFSHAMSIAQVCQPYNFIAISGTCQSILTEFENLKRQLESIPPDATMNNFFTSTLTDSLYRLERKINISVLTLVMDVFSDTYSPLRKLIKICGTLLDVNNRSKNDLQEAIEEFDQLTDKSILIGKFAIACCRDKIRITKIKNSLASFESLETELIPAIATFYLNPNDKEIHSSVKILTTQWLFEMDKFHESVNLIIDPSVYCQIILDNVCEQINEISQFLDNRQDITLKQVQNIKLKALALFRQIKATIDDIGEENVDKQTIMMTRELKVAIYEADAASKKFLICKSTPPEQLRVIKRCEILVKIIKRLLPALSSIVNNLITLNSDANKSVKKLGLDENSSSNTHGISFCHKYIRTPYSVKSYKQPLSIQTANTIKRNESDVSVLIPYIEKGRLMRSNWSVMYKTPNIGKSVKLVHNNLKMKRLLNIRQHLFSRDSFISEHEIDYTAQNIDISDLLDKLTDLSDTLRFKNSTLTSEKFQNLSKKQVTNIAENLEVVSIADEEHFTISKKNGN